MEKNNSNKLGTMPVGKLLMNMSLPAVFSMLLQALYNVVDSVFVAQMGQDALFAVGLVFPMQMLSLAIALGCGVGTNSMVARRLGQKKQEEAENTATTGLLLAVVHALLVAVVGFTLTRPFISMFTQDEQIIQMGTSYLMIVMCLCFGQHVQVVCERIYQGTGDMTIPMISVVISAGLNLILDPILIFGYFGCPAFGVAGAALATVIGQWCGMLFILILLFVKKDNVIKIETTNFHVHTDAVRDIYKIGVPTMIMNAIGSLTTTSLNTILVGFSDIAVNALSVYFKAQSFIFMPVFGMNQGGMPILSYNYGARDKVRYVKTVKLMVWIAAIILGAGSVLFNVAPYLILNIFNPTEELLEIGSVALRVISYSFIFAAIDIIMTTVFQSLGYSVRSMLMSILRQLVLLIPMAYIFSKMGLHMVWWAYPVSECVVMLIFTPQAIHAIKKCFQS